MSNLFNFLVSIANMCIKISKGDITTSSNINMEGNETEKKRKKHNECTHVRIIVPSLMFLSNTNIY